MSDGSLGHDCSDPDDCDEATHPEPCPDCGAWIHRGEPWLHHRIDHEEDAD